MQIYGPAHLHGPQSVNSPHNARQAQPSRTPSVSNTSDQLEISDAARLASQMSEIPEMRMDRVAQIKAAIADGSYETDAKLNVALDRLLDEIG